MLTGLAIQDRILLVLVIGIAVLFAFVLVFTISAILLRIKNQRKARMWRRLEDAWDPKVMDVLYDEADPSLLWEAVGSDVRLYAVDYLLRYMRRLAGEDRHRINQLAGPYLPLIARLTRNRGIERRARAVHTLGELGMPQYGDLVVRALDDPAALVAMAAARALARKEHPQFAGEILARLHRFANWRPNVLSAMLAGIGPEAAPALRWVLADRHEAPSVRSIAASALGMLNDFGSADVAATILRTEADRELVAASLRLLGRVGRAEDIPLIRQELQSDDPVVRGAAAGALGRLGDESDTASLHATARDDNSQWVAIVAARAVRDLGGTKILRELAASSHGRSALALQVLAEVGAS